MTDLEEEIGAKKVVTALPPHTLENLAAGVCCDDPDIAASAMKCIHTLACYDVNREAVVTVVCGPVVKGMGKLLTSRDVQLSGVLALGRLSLSPSLRASLRAQGAVKAVTDAMWAHPGYGGITGNGRAVLDNLK